MRATFSISSDVLSWIMAQVRYDTLPAKVAQSLQQWAAGVKQPTFNQIEATSKATGIPLGYFFLQSPPTEDVSLAQYRTIDSLEIRNPSRELIDTIHDMELVQEWTREHLLSEGMTRLPFIGNLKAEKSPVRFAERMRELLNFRIDWYKDAYQISDSFRLFRKRISDIGVLVMMNGVVGNNTHRALKINEFRAFAMVDNYAPLIFINAADSYSGRIFSLLHEFAHILIGENSLYNDRFGGSRTSKNTEVICNAVAAEILVPKSIFLIEWERATQEMDSEKAIQTLAREFRCGRTVIARRALDNGKIDSTIYQRIREFALRQYTDNQKGSGGSYYLTAQSRIDQRFFRMLSASVGEGKTLYSDAFRLTNTNRSTFTTLLQQTGGAKE